MTQTESEVFSAARATVQRMSKLAAASRCKARWEQTCPWERPESARIDDISEKVLKIKRTTVGAS